MPQHPDLISAQFLGSPQDSCQCAQAAGKTLLFLFCLENALRRKGFHLPQHFGVVGIGILLGVIMGEIGGGDQEDVLPLEGPGQGCAELLADLGVCERTMIGRSLNSLPRACCRKGSSISRECSWS